VDIVSESKHKVGWVGWSYKRFYPAALPEELAGDTGWTCFQNSSDLTWLFWMYILSCDMKLSNASSSFLSVED